MSIILASGWTAWIAWAVRYFGDERPIFPGTCGQKFSFQKRNELPSTTKHAASMLRDITCSEGCSQTSNSTLFQPSTLEEQRPITMKRFLNMTYVRSMVKYNLHCLICNSVPSNIFRLCHAQQNYWPLIMWFIAEVYNLSQCLLQHKSANV